MKTSLEKFLGLDCLPLEELRTKLNSVKFRRQLRKACTRARATGEYSRAEFLDIAKKNLSQCWALTGPPRRKGTCAAP